MEFVGILLICLHAVFHVPGTMVIIAIKLEAKCYFRVVTMFSHFKKEEHNKSYIFFRYLLP